MVDDADLLDCAAGGELSKITTRGAGLPLALALAGDPEGLAGGFGGWRLRPPAAALTRNSDRRCIPGIGLSFLAMIGSARLITAPVAWPGLTG